MKHLLTLASCLCLTALLSAQNIIHVKPNGNGDGKSWETACSLEEALRMADSVVSSLGITETIVLTPLSLQDQGKIPVIAVSRGTYYPDTTLVIPAYVSVIGGFDETKSELWIYEFWPSEDNLAYRTTVDAQNKFGSVFLLGEHAGLFGFIVQNGNAQLNPRRNGGGITAERNSVVENCILTHNTAMTNGGGIYAKGEMLVLNTTFENNTAQGKGNDFYGDCIIRFSGDCCSDKAFDFGTVSFETPVERIISGMAGEQKISQVWSDVVTATNCQKTTFDGGTPLGGFYFNRLFHADCRSNPDYAGDLFTWCAVTNYADVLCPAPWRVPTKDDFVNLDKILGGSGLVNGFQFNRTLYNRYVGTDANQWDGTSGGVSENGYCYWSQTEATYHYGYSLSIHQSPITIIGYRFNDSKSNGFSLRCVRDTIIPEEIAVACDSEDFDFGKVSFETPEERIITGEVDGQTISQIWSDAVTATNCQKTTFDGGQTNSLTTDCRANPNYPGDYFTWCAVANYGDVLCPAPWRVPTQDDFINLDKALGGTGVNGQSNSALFAKYLGTGVNQWGAVYGGYCNSTGGENNQGSYARYWSQTESASGNFGYYLFLSTDGTISPQHTSAKVFGQPLRCVRDTVIVEQTAVACDSEDFDFGKVSFETPAETVIIGTVDGQPLTQIWSDAVTAANCQKTAFNGGATGAFNVDCRTNPDYAGDYFTWCAVANYGDVLCPAPWRVPALEDFVNLDKAMGGTGAGGAGVSAMLPAYVGTGANQWAGVYGGYSSPHGGLNDQNSILYYWTQSQSETYANNGNRLYVTSSGSIYPQASGLKYDGYALRCVRDSIIYQAAVPCDSGGFDFGVVSFETPTERVITGIVDGQILSQVWSDAVTATNCQKTAYDGGNGAGILNVDCRSNPDYPGDFFSWCAVANYGDVLCPAPWRVPDTADFVKLDKALGGNGKPQYNNAVLRTNYLGTGTNQWGGVYGGYCWHNDELYSQGSGYYWSQSEYEYSVQSGLRLLITSDSYIQFSWYGKRAGMSLRCVRDTVIQVDEAGCSEEPFDFGEVSFETPAEHVVTGVVDGQVLSQIWSDAVTAENCQKTAFNGGTNGAFNVDCRTNPDYAGDYFTWCAVSRYATTLCPAPWRVPTKDDFINLDKTLGGYGENEQWDVTDLLDQYMGTGANQWSGVYGGYSNSDGAPEYQEWQANYWSQSEHNTSDGYHLSMMNGGYISPYSNNVKHLGMSLRCVRDTVIVPNTTTACDEGEFDFGTVSFETPTERIITGVVDGEILSQVWSDAVTATNCQKTTFDGGDWQAGIFNVDCRNNPDYPGDMFSWCAIHNYAEALCPAPWRVPDTTDFVNLDKAMGGTGENSQHNAALLAKYMGTSANQWGGVYGGNYYNGTYWGQGSTAIYWTQTEMSTTGAYILSLRSIGEISMSNKGLSKSAAVPLRCVRDTVISTSLVIVQHPDTTARLVEQGDAFPALTVKAVSAIQPLSYQWYSNTTASNTGGTNLGNAHGAQTDTFTPQSDNVDTLYYYCVVSNADTAVTSNVSGAQRVKVTPTYCSNNAFDLGTASFETNTQRLITGIVDGKRIGQIWSDAVTATNCQKTTFDGGTYPDHNTDCRTNPGYAGDLFTWCAVHNYAEVLCPAPWRVPKSSDFVNLDKAMGGSGANRTGIAAELQRYLGTGTNQWGGAFGGFGISNDDEVFDQGYVAAYWSQTYDPIFQALRLDEGGIFPQMFFAPQYAASLRCVRDTVIKDQVAVPCDSDDFDFGVVSFETPTERLITGMVDGQRVSQIWSDAVTATGCQKTTFDGGDWRAGIFVVDCRTNPGYPGDHFTWCAVANYADVLCPAPWRVPDTADFVKLDKALGGTGYSRASYSDTILIPYMGTGTNQWGGAYGSLHNVYNWIPYSNSQAIYWTKTDGSEWLAYCLEVTRPHSNIEIYEVSLKSGALESWGLALRCVRDTVIPEQTAVPCDSEDFDFGTVSFETPTERTITGIVDGQVVSQVWSDAVTTTNCQKTAFNGGYPGTYNVDCRTNPDYPGDLFTWCAVANYADVLCPAPWRVPDTADFINLYKALGGIEDNQDNHSTLLAKYLGTGANQWGGSYGGRVSFNGTLNDQGSIAYYWSQTEYNLLLAYSMDLWLSPASVTPQEYASAKGYGLALRCVRDTVIPEQTATPCDSDDFDFGIVSFETPAETVISGIVDGQVVSQVWSDAVRTTNCQKTTFDGGNNAAFNVDCRNNPDYPGDLFTWCAVANYADVLCPAPWRVPDTADFANLDKAMGGSGAGRSNAFAEFPKYLNTGANQWGGAYGGTCDNTNGLYNQGSQMHYWSQTSAIMPPIAYALLLNSNGYLYPWAIYGKHLGASLRCVRDTVIPEQTAVPCDSDDFDFGTVSFETPAETIVTGVVDGQKMSQVWSDAVRTTACQKTAFNGGNSDDGYNVDCRSNPDYPGDLFTWCAVANYADVLCPAPWRVPTKDDFIDLDKILGGTGNSQSNATLLDKYLGTGANQWGAVLGGLIQNSLAAQGIAAFYWSQTEDGYGHGDLSYNLFLQPPGITDPMYPSFKFEGLSLRCVRDTVLPQVAVPCDSDDFDFGEVSFETPVQRAIVGRVGEEMIGQIWSDAVTTTNCQKTAFDGGTSPNFNVDCRTNPSAAGDYFTWCAVANYGDVLCPAPWRVPTKDDFINLDKVLGGTGAYRRIDPNSADFLKYFNAWGAVYGGSCMSDGTLQSSVAFYWSQTENYASSGNCLILTSSGDIDPQYGTTKNYGLSLRCVRDTIIPQTAVPCNSDDFDFGEVSFETTTQRVITGKVDGHTFSQIWSDAVTATNCQKTAFDGGNSYPYNVDCRSNPSYAGDLFTWCAVANYADVLCPAPWRVPAMDDFIDLDKLLGGTGNNRTGATAELLKYLNAGANQWGGTYAGYCYQEGTLNGQGSEVSYWSQIEYNPDYGYDLLLISSDGYLYPQDFEYGMKNFGFPLRCVRDTVILQTAVPCNSDDFDFGEVSFETPTQRAIVGRVGEEMIGQIWSDAVTTTNCQKTTFDGGTTGAPNVDCRTNPNYAGDFFTWCAVANYADVLCPAPWRVPTREDFINLDKVLGGTGSYQTNTTLLAKYLGTAANQWDGTLGGICYPNGVSGFQDLSTLYWTQMEYGVSDGFCLRLDNSQGTGVIYPQAVDLKNYGGTLRCVRDTAVPQTAVPCNSDDFDFGEVSFETPTQRVITGRVGQQMIGQIWSDAVTTTNCQKTTFNGGNSTSGYNVDCRTNPDYAGDLFTWCAVANYGDVLCPAPWRVPTRDDFINLDKALGGTGANNPSNTTLLAQYVGTGANQWGAVYGGGYNETNGGLFNQGLRAYYWSQTEYSTNIGRAMSLLSSGSVNPQFTNTKYYGNALRCVRDTAVPQTAVPCDSDDFDFGEVSFETPTQRVITGRVGQQMIGQIWSAPVTTTNCQKTAFNGGATGALNVDCRTNPGYPGDYFTWCAVANYGDVLCPAPWRVPTKDDFVNLDKAMGGTGANRTGATAELPKYLGTGTNQWGAAYGGYCTQAGTSSAQGSYARYWSQTETSVSYGNFLYVNTSGYISPTSAIIKSNGFSLRCVRDTVIPQTAVPCNSDDFDFGEVSFETPTQRVITGKVDGQIIGQIWSDAVTATNCQKTVFGGGTTGAFNVDCRTNPNYPGDFFTWCAVANYGDVLCPAPWRVPTKEDFINLDKAMGGTGNNRGGATAEQLSKYFNTGVNQWGGAYGGWCPASGSPSLQGSYAYYWSQTEFGTSTSSGYNLYLMSENGQIYPQYSYLKGTGFALRCVMDFMPAPDVENCNTYAVDFGTVSFATPTRRIITGEVDGQIRSQVWSDAVTATHCQKTAFYGGTERFAPDGSITGTFDVDCRSNPGYAGDLFTWCAVRHYPKIFCPSPWRVPTPDDFINLDKMLGGDGNPHSSSNVVVPYLGTGINQWGGACGGYANVSGTINYQSDQGWYWAMGLSRLTGGSGDNMKVYSMGSVFPQTTATKSSGLSLRCVKDTVLLPDASGCNTYPVDLGEVGFKTSAEYAITGTVDGKPATQVWSDPVIADYCQKTTFDGGTPGAFNVDCRSNSGYGDLFTWCAVSHYQDVLCPAPWRVPTKNDFITLDKMLGGSGSAHSSSTTATDYLGTGINQWGGACGGYAVGHHINYKSLQGWYWAVLPEWVLGGLIQDPNSGDCMAVYSVGSVFPQNTMSKSAGLTLRCVKNTFIQQEAVPCNSTDFDFGRVSFETKTQRVIIERVGQQMIGQIWSDAVAATNCQKTAFNGGTTTAPKVDCRTNPNYSGDLFTWCAVANYGNVLCPAPWRVPTKDDFVNLDKALGGTGNNQTNTTLLAQYVGTGAGQWGSTYGGYSGATGTLYNQGSYAHYWSQTVYSTYSGYRMYLNSSGSIYPQVYVSKFNGHTLRCVRDTVVPQAAVPCNSGDFNFGTVRFETNTQRVITGRDGKQMIGQIWSDAVTATNCQKTAFNGGVNGDGMMGGNGPAYNVDCRSNPNYSGDLFSWCAVANNGNVLCPAPWRVPSKDDFIKLDKTLGGIGNSQTNTALLAKYVGTGANQWNGKLGGYSTSTGTLSAQGSNAYYWSQTRYTAMATLLAEYGYHLYLSNTGGNVNPQDDNVKYYGYTLRCVRDTVVPQTAVSCNSDDFDFGTVHFETPAQRVITGSDGQQMIGQIWSDAVTATNCQKTAFNGGTTTASNVDCRTNPNYSGDLFTWCAVANYASTLCPAPWRVPTKDDLIKLDKALGGTGNSQTNTTLLAKYVGTGANQWGGFYGGLCYESGAPDFPTVRAYYWSQTENSSTQSHSLLFYSNGAIQPQNTNYKNLGLPLRCVRDTAIQQAAVPCDSDDFDFGEVSFETPTVRTIIGVVNGTRIRQTWSDPVTATNCQKTTFNGGVTNAFNVDCRSNPNSPGDLFTWCAISNYADVLCPGDWHVPTKDDFINLDKAMGGTGINHTDATAEELSRYLGTGTNQWGGAYGGICNSSGEIQNTGGYYWSQTETGATASYDLFLSSGSIFPWYGHLKYHGLTLRCIKDVVLEQVLVPCVYNYNFGTVSFQTPTVRTVTGVVNGQTISQTWSDAVTATNCQKTDFYGGTTTVPGISCRSNPGYPGDLFSWCAIANQGDVLCPAPWRVPTKDDFITLDKILGGTGYNTQVATSSLPNYVGTGANQWGAVYGGQCHSDGTLLNQGTTAHYWSQTESSTNNGHYLFVSQYNIVYPQGVYDKYYGYTLRCVK